MARTRDEAARRRVLDSARDLVCELGPRAVTVDGIAAAAGVGKQTIYRWWPSKSAVIMDALIELTDPEPADTPDSTREAILLQMRRVARLFASRQGQLIRELVADAQGDLALAEDFRRRFFAHRRARGAATITSGIARGELRPDLDVDDALDVLYGPLWLRLLIGHRPTSPGEVEQLLDLIWPGIVNPASSSRPADHRRTAMSGAGPSDEATHVPVDPSNVPPPADGRDQPPSPPRPSHPGSRQRPRRERSVGAGSHTEKGRLAPPEA